MTYQDFQVIGPFKGIYDSVPDPNSPPESFRDVLNFFSRKGRLQTRPRLNTFVAPPDGAIVRSMQTFLDVNGNLHTLCLTTQNAYYIDQSGVYTALTLPVGVTTLIGTSLPYAVQYINDRLYFCNGSTPVLYCDGEADLKVAGNVQGGCRYMAVNAAHLLLAYMTEPFYGEVGSKDYKKRVRWSKSGIPDNWTDFSSGFNDLLEVPDAITGMAALGSVTAVFRSNGITMAYPTGVGLSPFRFEQYSYSPKGVGNQFPYSLAIYNRQAVFAASDDIYIIDSSNLTPIGGSCKRRIFNDLEQSSGDVVAGFIVPRFGVGFDFLSYWLSIPGINVTWVFHYDEQSWVRFESSYGRLTCINNVAVG